MNNNYACKLIVLTSFLIIGITASPQKTSKTSFTDLSLYSGIEVGSKGVKLSVIEIGKNAKTTGAFSILKDTSVNTDFISFSNTTFSATLAGFSDLYNFALSEYKIPPGKIFTVISSGVKMQADKEGKTEWINKLVDSFRIKLNEPGRKVDVVDVMDEARLSHLGIVPEKRRYSTFLIDIGSGNTKGGFFPGNDTKTFRLFQLNWGTKSTFNEAAKRTDGDNSLPVFNKFLNRVLFGAEQTDIIYAVNASGAYALSDNIAISGGIAWAVSTLMYPEQIQNSVVTLSYSDMVNFSETLFRNYKALSAETLTKNISSKQEKDAVTKEINRVQQVFDQKSLMAGTGLMLKIMRQFESVFDTKQFFLVKNGQVGWVSAYVDQSIR